MTPRDISETLQAALARQGYKSAIVSAEHVAELRETIRKKRAARLIDSAASRQYAGYLDKMLTQDVPWARSIVVVAVPRPLLEVTVTVDGRRHPVVIPPTYEHSIDETVTAAIKTALSPHDLQACRATLPLKLLATQSGLARYGKNNITYVEGMGSFHRLLAFYTDLPTVNETWQDPQELDECNGCKACTNKCPTGAIDPDQFQLRVERCLTFHNESPEPFPQWMDSSWHHCLVGCMRCQHYCPVNKEVRTWTERFAELTGQETALLLRGATNDELPPSLIAKFNSTGLLEDVVGLSRNLRSVIAAAEQHDQVCS